MKTTVFKISERGELSKWDLEIVKRDKSYALIAHHEDLGDVVLAEGKKEDVERAIEMHVEKVKRHNQQIVTRAREMLMRSFGFDTDRLDQFLASCLVNPVPVRRGWVLNVSGIPDAIIPQCETTDQAAIVAVNVLRLNLDEQGFVP